jgi:hypothetical protein
MSRDNNEMNRYLAINKLDQGIYNYLMTLYRLKFELNNFDCGTLVDRHLVRVGKNI